MPQARRTIRHADHGPNRHKARIGRRLAILSQRMRDLAAELDQIDWPHKAGELRGAAGIARQWADALNPQAAA